LSTLVDEFFRLDLVKIENMEMGDCGWSELRSGFEAERFNTEGFSGVIGRLWSERVFPAREAESLGVEPVVELKTQHFTCNTLGLTPC